MTRYYILKNAAEFLGMKKGDMITFYEENGKVYVKGEFK